MDHNAHTVAFDGVVFPFYMGAEGVDLLNVGTDHDIPSVSLRVLAETVEVIPAAPKEA